MCANLALRGQVAGSEPKNHSKGFTVKHEKNLLNILMHFKSSNFKLKKRLCSCVINLNKLAYVQNLDFKMKKLVYFDKSYINMKIN